MGDATILITPTLLDAASKTTNNNILAMNKYENLTLEPASKDIVEYKHNNTDGTDAAADAVTTEEEIITKKKTELTTTRQIETRVKRQVLLEDGKVVEDSGPIVSTNTTEDTEKQQSESTERRNLGDNDEVDGPRAIATEGNATDLDIPHNEKRITHTNVARSDGLVRESKEKKVVSREEIDERVETEDIQVLGDFSDELYVKAVSSGVDNFQDALLSVDTKKALVPAGPKIVHQSIKSKKTIDTEDTDLKCLAQPDGTLVTEKKQTTEHEVLIDEDLPEEDDLSTGSREKVEHKESSQRFHKQRDEQKVDYVANGKVIGTEMRYAAETQGMERDGPTENPSDWDSLSDRVRKARRQNQKTLLQQQRETIGERRDALTKRPLDFDKEEEIRKCETNRWLESHFGSDSQSSHDSIDFEVEPTKKTYFNVTIKSNANPSPSRQISSPIQNDSLRSPPRPIVPEKLQDEAKPQKPSYLKGKTDWSDSKEKPVPKSFSSKAFQEELKQTLEKKHKLTKQTSLPISEKINRVKEESSYQKKNGIRSPSRDDSDDSRFIRVPKEDPGYMSGSKNDLQYRRDSREEIDRNNKTNGYLRREDSGYVKDSREDLRCGGIKNGRDEINEKEKPRQQSIQRDDSAYISSSTYLTAPRSPRHNIAPSPPVPPQRKRAMEKKLRAASVSRDESYVLSQEPRPDYSPPPSPSPPQTEHQFLQPHSRSGSPYQNQSPPLQNGNAKHQQQNTKYQKTRFESDRSEATTAPRLSPQKQRKSSSPSRKVGSAIGNSIRKLVGKIRSASAERKMKLKSKQRSSSPLKTSQLTPSNSTYQQYNIIDAHIGPHGQQQQTQQRQSQPQQQQHHSNHINDSRETSICDSVVSGSRRDRSNSQFATLERRGSSEIDMTAVNPTKQRYYLGEDPYGGSIYGRENKYDGLRLQQQRNRRQQQQQQHHELQKTEEPEIYVSRLNNRIPGNQINASTLGRYSKSTNRLISNSRDEDNGYRSVQTLPRKLERKPAHSSTINVSIVNTVQNSPTHANYINGGPAKPARTYKSLNRSKSFNVHGLNGTSDPSPIYMSKLTKNFQNSSMYKSNPHLSESGMQLKSPSIVNLVSRSQRDLSRIDARDDERKSSVGYLLDKHPVFDKKQVFLKGLQDQAPELYKTLHGDEELMKYRERESSLGSRSPITINKDTASIVRRGSSSTDDYNETYKFTTKSENPHRPSVTNTVQNFSKKTVPTNGGQQTIQSSETKSVTTSRYRGEPQYVSKIARGRMESPGPVVIELRRNGRR